MLKLFLFCVILIFTKGINSIPINEEDSEIENKSLADQIQRYINSSVDPCDDFFKYACGNWPTYHPLVDDEIENTPFQELVNDINKDIKNLLERPLDYIKTPISKSEHKARAFYKSCTKTTSEDENIKSMLEVIDLFGGWPIVNDSNWNEENFNWVNLTAHLRLYGIQALIEQEVGKSFNNSQESFIYITPANFELTDTNDYLNSYVNISNILVQKTISTFGVPEDIATEAANDIIEFENKRAAIFNKESIKLLSPTAVTFEDLLKNIPEIDWKTYFSIIFEEPFNSSNSIGIIDENYFKQLGTLLSETDPKIVANYLIFKFVEKYFAEEHDWNSCMEQVKEKLGPIIGAMYLPGHVNEGLLKDVSEMISEIQNSFKENFNQLTWLDDATRVAAEDKLSSMSSIVGFNSLYNDFNKLDTDYADLDIDENNYYKNLLNCFRYETRLENKELDKLSTVKEKFIQPADISPLYDFRKNYIYVPLGILHPPIYGDNYPKSYLYGGIGFTLGHEVTHGFDSLGRQFDKEGLLQNWFSMDAADTFDDQMKCFISQYSNYTVFGKSLKVDGDKSLGENIADNGGIRFAFYGYKNWLKKNADKENLEIANLLKMTNEQVFFLRFAQTFCEATGPVGMLVRAAYDEHTPVRYRIIGTLSNFNEFAEEFKCPLGSTMNPEKKCKIW